ncbi:D-isomer specific 2-hydroxyacid dehydrogenase NAD-binding protein [Emticicia oligotrophica DSM 17448]|uniref:D-isomer specific 2-hydroxyacid dehydrogenase NAD-binding protein n=2 Tax=Emticicia TaxID=312278 RepID=A0ABM5N7P0_EMTOG|nr:D-isomer specific 2-hydroxyacid dehydrogenase NAD-binding protein [Emticicia oligotrophica DSM 17448]
MLKRIDEFRSFFEEKNIELIIPNIVQTLSEEELEEILPTVDGWIIGDDPASERVFTAGKKGKLKAAVKWGVGIDNVDFAACKKLGIPIINTPNMFGAEVATVATSYVLGLARQTYFIDREVRKGNWVKPAGRSLSGLVVGLIGFGDIGKATARFLKGFDMKINIYDPFVNKEESDLQNYNFLSFPEKIEEADFVITTCALTPSTRNMVNADIINNMKDGVYIINVSRGGIVNEADLLVALQSGKVEAAALDVFETEPFPIDSGLREFDKCIFGTHNGSNTIEGVRRASHQAISYLFEFLGV